QDGTPQQKQELQAEAMAERAFTHFQLFSYFTKPYNAATAATDPGFPLIKTADITATGFSRGTVQEGYDFMVQDLTQAIPSLAANQPGRTRMSKAGAETLLGKIYLSMGKYPEALAVLKSVFSDITSMPQAPVLYDYNQTLAPGGSFLPVSPINGPNSPFVNATDVTESIWAAFTYVGPYNGNPYSVDFLTIPAKTVALFDPSDWRLQFYTHLQTDQSTVIPGGRLRRYNLVYARVGAQLPDLYLMKAEAEARTGNLAGAVADVETLRRHRMPEAVAAVPAAIAADQNNLVKFIIEERIREFAMEGVRWFDMRRLSADPLFAGQPAPQHVVYDDATNGTVYTLKPERLTLKLPPVYLSQNPGMADNP
ncbi:MAG TPA: RagB/SusD family nutrient uptake outer membrane protein, partial [Chitinophaga sp.]